MAQRIQQPQHSHNASADSAVPGQTAVMSRPVRKDAAVISDSEALACDLEVLLRWCVDHLLSHGAWLDELSMALDP